MDNDMNRVIELPHVAPSFPGMVRDASERSRAPARREWAEAQLAGENRLLEMIASGHSLRDVLTSLCNFVEDAAPECSCGVYLIDWSGPTFQLGAAPSLPESYTAPIKGLPVRCEIAPCGVAALLKKQVISADLEADPLWSETPYCAHVLSHGLRSVWSTPIFSLSGGVLGTFAIYHRNTALPSPRLHNLIAQVTHIASIAIERAQIQAELQRSEAFLAHGERLSHTGTFSWRAATDEIKWSAETYRIHGMDPDARVTFEVMLSRIHPEDVPAFLAHADRARADGRDLDIEYRLRMPDGSIKHVRVLARSSRDGTSQPEYMGAIQDITDHRRQEQALGKLRAELAHVARVSSLGALTASIAHEVNQPLSGIVTNASTSLRMLAANPPNIDGARETARRTIRDANRASDVITRLRALFDKKSITTESIDLNEATREVIMLASGDLQRGDVVVRAELAPDLGMIVGDRVQLQQVILNLVRNATDAMALVDDRTRQLTILTELEAGDCVRLSVRDNGVGVDAHNAEQLFDAFYTTKQGGMGMGLAVSRSIVQNHHGRLWATPNDGHGVTFSFSIPRRSAATMSHRAVDAESSSFAGVSYAATQP